MKNKIIFIIITLIFIVTIFTIPSKATYKGSFTHNDKQIFYNMPEDCLNYVIGVNGDQYFLLYTNDIKNYTSVTRDSHDYWNIRFYTDRSFSTTVNYKRSRGSYKYDGINAKRDSEGNYYLDFANCGYLDYGDYTCINTFIKSYNDIYMGDDIFFQVTPQVAIQEITQVEELPKIIMKVLKVIIPAGLVVLSIGLLIYVIKLVILRVI